MECAVCGAVGPYPVFVRNAQGEYVLEHRCADHLPTDD